MSYTNGWEMIVHAMLCGLSFHIAIHFLVLPTASRLWDWALH